MVDLADEEDTKPGTSREVESRSLESQHYEFPIGQSQSTEAKAAGSPRKRGKGPEKQTERYSLRR